MKKKLWTGCIVVLLCAMALGMTSFAASGKSMKNKKWISAAGGIYIDEDKDGIKEEFELYDTQYYKIKIPRQGYMVVDVKASSIPGVKEYDNYWAVQFKGDGEFAEGTEESLDVGILNNKKKELKYFTNLMSKKKDMKFSWAVKKGTYYLAVKGNQKYKIRYTFTPVSKVDKVGKSMDKAVVLKKGVTVKNLLSHEKDHYYKITVPEKSKVVLSINSKIAGAEWSNLAVQMNVKQGKKCRQIDKKGKLTPKESFYWYDIEGKDTLAYTLPQGTYYLRVFSFGSGYYTLKWK